MANSISCPGCDKTLVRNTTKPERYRKHAGCDFSQTVVREEEECSPSTPPPSATSPTASSARPSPEDVTETADLATSSTDSSPSSRGDGEDASTSASASPALPGVTSYVNTLAGTVESQRDAYRAEVEAKVKTRISRPHPHDYERPTLFSQPWLGFLGDDVEIRLPEPPKPRAISQPAGRRSELPAEPMSREGAEIAARLKEMFYAYDNRRSSDNRSAQTTMGPSEMGTPCDRRLALSLMRMPPVNPGGDGWAAFVGTAIHASLEEMFLWADAGTGRFAVEQRLEFGHPIVPKGTADLLDRTLLMVLDHKCQGRWSRNKLKSQGPIPTYKVQAHVYAHGARLRGEDIQKVAIVSWPRDESTLDDLYVWVDDYDPAIVKKAFERVDGIGAKVEELGLMDAELETKALGAANFKVADDCRFCPFYMPNARDITKGCNGKR